MADVSPENGATGSDLQVDWNSSSEDAIQNAIEDDPDLQQLAARLDSEVTLDPDRNLKIETNSDASDSLNKDSDSISTTSSHRETDDNKGDDNNSPKSSPKEPQSKRESPTSSETKSTKRSSISSETKSTKPSSISNGDSKRPSDRKQSVDSTGKASSVKSKSSADDGEKSSSKNPLKILRRLTKLDKPAKKSPTPESHSEFTAMVIDRLPQVFVVKYLGCRKVSGVCGLHHVRRPVDEMVKEAKDKMGEKSSVELPLLYVVVSPKGLDLREHKMNKIKDVAPLGVLPIDFISYGVQDIKFWRVFTCIVVTELSAKARTATCHAFLCNSSEKGRLMALSLGAAFNVYSKKLKSAGKTHNFQVELRPPDELADAVDAECEA